MNTVKNEGMNECGELSGHVGQDNTAPSSRTTQHLLFSVLHCIVTVFFPTSVLRPQKERLCSYMVSRGGHMRNLTGY